jgi:hypothetical protein
MRKFGIGDIVKGRVTGTYRVNTFRYLGTEAYAVVSPVHPVTLKELGLEERMISVDLLHESEETASRLCTP